MTRLVTLWLVLSLGLTGPAMAVGQVAPGPSGAMVICAGGKMALVLTDEDGLPMEASHLCPDCIPAAMLQDGRPPESAPKAERRALFGVIAETPAPASERLLLPPARASPALA